ncbi:hypothetical protein GWK47_041652 [Chionoecetes opilio]|uniref:Major facilitator superfamily associated domain-containing protein n=1 Tax=Chionoecetes opilio TaxID=41210 RepID=A0A8J4YB71_CHIOP|nr:hypothetical protein GWK47_041652 [Chionoecetes opilio]
MELSALIQYPQFWLVFFALMVEQMGISTSNTMADTVCMQILGSERHNTASAPGGPTIGRGSRPFSIGYLIDWKLPGAAGEGLPTRCHRVIVVMFADVVFGGQDAHSLPQGPAAEDGGGAHQAHAPPRPALPGNRMTVYVMGSRWGSCGCFKNHAGGGRALGGTQSSSTQAPPGHELAIESFLGEVPFFFYRSVWVPAVLATGTGVAGGEVFVSTIPSAIPGFFLPIELLNGLSYSLFHSAMASYASFIAPQGAQATLQSVVRATFVGGESSCGGVKDDTQVDAFTNNPERR